MTLSTFHTGCRVLTIPVIKSSPIRNTSRSCNRRVARASPFVDNATENVYPTAYQANLLFLGFSMVYGQLGRGSHPLRHFYDYNIVLIV